MRFRRRLTAWWSGDTDRSALRNAIAAARAEVVKEDVYTAEILAELQQAIKTAQRVLDDMTAGQEAIDEQTELVNTALKNLVKQEIPSADRTALDAKLNEARVEAEKTDIYTADSIAYLNQVIAEVENTAAAENLHPDPDCFWCRY